MQHQHLFVFDIETIPDTNVLPLLTGESFSDVTQARQALTQYHLDATDGKNDFLKQPFHKIVAISFLEAEIKREGNHESYRLIQLRSGGKLDAPESVLVQGFFQHLGKTLPRLVSFNGRMFDLPVLKYRAMLHQIQAPWLYKSGDKWNSYQSRYSSDWHCDLIEVLSDYGASSKIKLHEICSLLGLPGKLGIDGSDVACLYDQGRIEDIRNYCETDVCNTYLVYLRTQHHQGTLSKQAYKEALGDLESYLGQEASTRPHLQEFLTAWHDASMLEQAL